MAVRLTIEINSAATVSALANSGYETDECEILVPLPFAKDNMGLSLKDGKAITYIAADKKEVRFYQMGKVKVRVITDDKKSEYVEAALLVSESEEQVVLNDKLVGGLGTDLVNVAEGTWRFSDDPVDKLRKSSMPQLFH
ncbi:MAG: hypothetical protein IIA88_09225 [Bacteroidetes bacterium]|nr:hypothetical protein [Bacteroidota bacterium]